MIDLKKKYTVYELFQKGVVSATVINHAEISKTFANQVKICESAKEAAINTAQKHNCHPRTVYKAVKTFE